MPFDDAPIEIERISNMVRNFDWTIKKQEILEDKIILTIEKLRLAVIPPVAKGVA